MIKNKECVNIYIEKSISGGFVMITKEEFTKIKLKLAIVNFTPLFVFLFFSEINSTKITTLFCNLQIFVEIN